MTTTILLLLNLSLFATRSLQSHNPPYLTSPNTFHYNHHKMLQSFKIYIYPKYTSHTSSFKSPAESAFYSTLLSSSFLTSDPDEAHFFFIPFISSALSSRSISRHIRDIRSNYPFWNRTLGADHFHLHCHGLGYESDRNLVELKKNAVQISCFPTEYGRFIPHKDITLPPLNHSPRLKYLKSKDYCLMSYEDGSVGMIGDALRLGCVPVVVVGNGSAAQDLPMMGVVRWAEMALFVGGGGVDVDEEAARRVLRKVESGYESMRGLGVAAARHFAWGGDDQYNTFHSVLYQLWVRRHVIRYARVVVHDASVLQSE